MIKIMATIVYKDLFPNMFWYKNDKTVMSFQVTTIASFLKTLASFKLFFVVLAQHSFFLEIYVCTYESIICMEPNDIANIQQCTDDHLLGICTTIC